MIDRKRLKIKGLVKDIKKIYIKCKNDNINIIIIELNV